MQNLQIIRQNDLLCLKNATASSAEAWKKEGQFQTSSIALNETQIGQIVIFCPPLLRKSQANSHHNIVWSIYLDFFWLKCGHVLQG